MKKLINITREEITDILLDFMDNGDWHSPSVGSLEILEHGENYVYGKFKSSLHSTFRDEDRGFEITTDTVKVFGFEMKVNAQGTLIEKRVYKPIFNIFKVAEKLSVFVEKNAKV